MDIVLFTLFSSDSNPSTLLNPTTILLNLISTVLAYITDALNIHIVWATIQGATVSGRQVLNFLDPFYFDI